MSPNGPKKTSCSTTTADFAKRPAPISFSGLRFSVDCAGGDESGQLTIYVKDEDDMCAKPPMIRIKVTP